MAAISDINFELGNPGGFANGGRQEQVSNTKNLMEIIDTVLALFDQDIFEEEDDTN